MLIHVDRRKDMTEVMGTFQDSANVPKNTISDPMLS
jgi:hypothetical protein